MNLYQLARLVATGKALASGDPGRMGRRGRNIILGRLLARMRFWRFLWRG